MLDSVSDINTKKQLIGERLYHRINDTGESDASKLTGIILSLDIDTLFNLLSDDVALADSIRVAKQRLNEKQKQQEIAISVIQDEINSMRQDLDKEIGNTDSQSRGKNQENRS